MMNVGAGAVVGCVLVFVVNDGGSCVGGKSGGEYGLCVLISAVRVEKGASGRSQGNQVQNWEGNGVGVP